MVIGHCDSFLDRDYHRTLLRRGAGSSFDICGRLNMNPDDRRADALLELVREGRLYRLLISSDRCLRSDLVAFGDPRYAHFLAGFRAELLSRGLSTEEFDVLTVANPATVLAT